MPLPSGCDSRRFRERITAEMLLAEWAPELIIISADFDANALDPLAGLSLTDDDFAWITRALVAQAAVSAQGRIVSILEGGYSLQGLATASAEHVRVLMA